MSSLLLILLALTGNHYLTADNSVSNIFYKTALETSKNELALHNYLIGKLFGKLDSVIVGQVEYLYVDQQKIVVVLLEKEAHISNYQNTVIDALDLYANLADTTSYMENTKIILSIRNQFDRLVSYTNKYYRDEIDLFVDSSGVFSQLYALSDRGAIVMLLNQRNICLYAYYLERDNNRKIYENSAVIFRLLKNLHEEKI